VTKVAAGHHSAALTDKGDLFIWGTGVFGEYDIPMLFGTFQAIDISVGSTFGVVLDANSNLYSWGTNSNGELGVGDFEIRKTPSLIKGLQGKVVTKVSCGGSYVIALGGNITKSLERYGNDGLRVVNERRSVVEKEAKYSEQYSMQSNQHLQDQIAALELQIEAERKRKQNLERSSQFITNQGAIQREIDLLREENERMTRKTKDGSKLSELLGEYEEKIEAEVKDKQRIVREKQQEINNLRDTIPKLKATINDLEKHKMQFENRCKEEIRRLESIVSNYNSQIHKEESTKAELLSIHNDNIRKITELNQRLTETIREKDKLSKEIEAYKSEIDQLNYQTNNKQGELREELGKQESLKSSLATKENDIQRIQADYNHKAIEYKTEIDNIRRQITDITYDNETIQSKINVKQVEIDTSNKDLIAWKQVVNNVTGENSALRNIIAKLEEKQRRLINSESSTDWRKVLHKLETYGTGEDEGRVIAETEKIADPYLEERRSSLH
jgi:X-linked retinitis pigmentosa GTPase regulator